MQASPMLSLSSSFSRYSNTNITEIAARVVDEFRAENETVESEFFFNHNHETFNCLKADDEKEQNNEDTDHEKDVAADDDDFEFAFVTCSTGSDQISADEIFYNGQIRPIFNRDLLLNDVKYKTSCSSEKVSTDPPKSIRVPLRKVFIEDHEFTSSETNDLEGIPPGTYCVWRPREAEESPSGRCKKSNSTGSSSKRWKLCDFLYRSNSDGEETFVYLTTPFKRREEKPEKMRTDSAKISTGKVTTVPVPAAVTGGDKRKSYLPYRQDLIGFFSNVNGLNRKLQHL